MLKVRGNHPDLHQILTLHAHIEQVREYRTLVLHLLAVAGGLCWIAADWPGVVPRFWTLAVIAAWPAMFVAFVVLVVLELRCGWRLKILIGDLRSFEAPPSLSPGAGNSGMRDQY